MIYVVIELVDVGLAIIFAEVRHVDDVLMDDAMQPVHTTFFHTGGSVLHKGRIGVLLNDYHDAMTAESVEHSGYLHHSVFRSVMHGNLPYSFSTQSIRAVGYPMAKTADISVFLGPILLSLLLVFKVADNIVKTV